MKDQADKNDAGPLKNGADVAQSSKPQAQLLSASHPLLVKEWHPTKNLPLIPDAIIAGSNKKVWWQCPKDSEHVWEAQIGDRTKKKPTGCPFCRGLKVCSSNSLAQTFPALANQWHPSRNGDLGPQDVVPGTGQKVWWICPAGPDHEWEAIVSNRTKPTHPTGCPFCSGWRVSVTNSLATVSPMIAAQWHPFKNGSNRPEEVANNSKKKAWWQCPKNSEHEWCTSICNRTRKTKGSNCPQCLGRRVNLDYSLEDKLPQLMSEWHSEANKGIDPFELSPDAKVWWKCPKGPDHDWQATLASRARSKRPGCPFCRGFKPSVTNSLASLFPDLFLEIHPNKNGEIDSSELVAGSTLSLWWRCRRDPTHEWQATVRDRAKKKLTGCPFCSEHLLSPDESLMSKFPILAAQWHPTRNGELSPAEVLPGTVRLIWWQCPVHSDHEWQTRILERTKDNGTGCPYCAGKRVSATNSLSMTSPDVAAQWHPTKNGLMVPREVVNGSHLNAWWLCPQGHDYQAQVYKRTKEGRGCPRCSGRNYHSVAHYAEMAQQWDHEKNGSLKPEQILGSSKEKVWWKCPNGPDHSWQASPNTRINKRRGCHQCAGRKASVTNSLASLFPGIASELHPSLNGALRAEDLVAGTETKVWWLCPEVQDHAYEATVYHRTIRGSGCPLCNRGWTLPSIRAFVGSLKEHLQTFTPAELFVLFQQSGMLTSFGKGPVLAKAICSGRLPKGELEKFIKDQPSIVDDILQEQSTENGVGNSVENAEASEQIATGELHKNSEDLKPYGDLPLVESKDVLSTLALHAVTSADQEAIEFLLSSAVSKLWKHAYRAEDIAVKQIREWTGTGYAAAVKDRFLTEYEAARSVKIPPEYDFKIGNRLTLPNLMQLHFVSLVCTRKRVGNWSGTGAGKTLSAILSTRTMPSTRTIICCPNSVVEGWCAAISSIFPNSKVASRTFTPDWATDSEGHCYLVMHYESFQQPDSSARLLDLLNRVKLDFIVIDEIHFAKQRGEDISLRRALVNELVAVAAEKNTDIHVLGLSATPIINNLQEGRSMVELITGLSHDELATKPTIGNCMALHQRLVTLGIRWMPEYDLKYEQLEIPVDCGPFLDEIRALGLNGTPLALEQILTKVRLPEICRHIVPKTLIYTYHISGIDKILRDSLQQRGWKVGFFYGEDKSGLQGFLHGDVDVLIATSAIATGVDGLQEVCNRVIVNDLPWTAAEFEQLKGRVFRQGQRSESVSMIIPLTYAQIGEDRWSWCESKMQRLHFKRSIADAAVDGVVPDGHIRTPAQAYRDLMSWLERLQAGRMETFVRRRVEIETASSAVSKAIRKYGDFSKLNQIWNASKSDSTHSRLRSSSEEWEHYHALYRAQRKDWAVIPFEELILWYKKRRNANLVIGDFGCGEAKIAEELAELHTVYSFDHVAVNEDVIACDMAHTSLDDETLDVAIFCLSLMGANFSDYLAEARRTLRLDGVLHIIESTSRFSDRALFVQALKEMGFDIIEIDDLWKFTHIRALKSDREPKAATTFHF